MTKSKNNLKDIFSQLENISAFFQTEDLDLNDAFMKYEKATKLIKQAKDELKVAKNKLKLVAVKD